MVVADAAVSRARAGLLVALALLVGACSAARPSRPEDLCSILRERSEWYEALRASEHRWGVPVPQQLAVIHQESGFDASARPPRSSILWIFPGPRLSSAYGYGQVLDSTWDWYQDSRGGGLASRDDLEDVADFLGWSGGVGEQRFGIPRDDPRAYYAAYHEGHRGYLRGSHRRKPGVLRAASSVEHRTRLYAAQYARCRRELEEALEGPWWWPF